LRSVSLRWRLSRNRLGGCGRPPVLPEAPMFTPVRTVDPATTPVSLTEAKAHLRVDFDDDDDLITALIAAATDHVDGWAGVLGRALVTQTWRQDFNCFRPSLRLPLAPASEIKSVTYLDPDGVQQTVDPSNYALWADGAGPLVYFVTGFSPPATSIEGKAVSVTYVAGYGDADAVPAPIKAAILLLIGQWYENREAAISAPGTMQTLPFAVDALLTPYRRVGV
jgi:uncharacterized phiE125 gp8 family phage protein